MYKQTTSDNFYAHVAQYAAECDDCFEPLKGQWAFSPNNGADASVCECCYLLGKYAATGRKCRTLLAEAANVGPSTVPFRLFAYSPRSTVIEWLCTNDRNGCYSDADMVAEWGAPMTEAEAWGALAFVLEQD